MAADAGRRFFASYNRGESGWTYSLGQFAQMSLPLADSATLTIVRNGSFVPEIITVSAPPWACVRT